MADISLLNKSFPAYEVCQGEKLSDIESEGLVLRHKKTGAKVCLISNDDDNKVFFIGFRTPPSDSTGVAHIIEHTVLCGSKQFPVKDPFIELAKGSLNTFLNAMTYPDKTLYPVASCNMQDIKNLMHVYMDAVFYPNIYKHEEIFKQEGWHYELDCPEGELKINGVVYNEMKGAYSSAEDLLDTRVNAALYSDVTYGLSSGGDPDVIPELSYEEYLDFHRRYYHPSNSYIYLYGDFDMEERLEWIDREYLSAFDYQPVDSEIPFTAEWSEPKYVTDEYPVGEEEETKDKTYLSYNLVIGDTLDVKKCYAWDVLASVLFGTPGAPVREAIMDAGIGKDILGGFAGYIKQPCLMLVAKDTEAEKMQEFISIVEKTLKEQIEKGINKESLLGAINIREFDYRESDSGNFPKGLVYGINLLNSWLYDDNRVFDYCKVNAIFEELRKEIETGWFEELIKTDVLDNNHKVFHSFVPSPGMTEKKEQKLKESLKAYKDGLSNEEISGLVESTKALTAYQEAEETPEALASLPVLKVSDMKKEAPQINNSEISIAGVKTIHHDIATNGISYISLKFDTAGLPEELWSYASLLVRVLGIANTEKHSYLELVNEININTGGVNFFWDTYSVMDNTSDFKAYIMAETKVLTEKTDKAIELISEIITKTVFEDKKRLKQIIGEGVSDKQMVLIGSGHNTAISRAQSYFSPIAYFKQKTVGIDYYEFLKELYNDFDNRADDLIEKLKKIAECVLIPENMIVSLVCREEGLKALEKPLYDLIDDISGRCKECLEQSFENGFEALQKNEAFKISGQVQYAATAGNYKNAGLPYKGALAVTRTILAYDYLWTNVRVKGGAYGCFFSYETISGNCGMVSYRDPNLKASYDVYNNAADYIRGLNLTQEEVDKYIIGTLSRTDAPRNAKQQGNFSFSCYVSGVDHEYLQKERDEILGASLETIKETAEIVECAVNQGNICTVGSAAKVIEDKELFKEIKELN